MNEFQIFCNEDIGISVRTILNPDGSISINAEDTAFGFGWTQVHMKNGKEYKSVRWERLNAFSAEFGFPHEWGKDDFIPESLFYRLGMKANNRVADKFQNWLAMEVVPAIRKTGSYGKPMTTAEQIQLLAKGNMELSQKIESVDRDLQDFKKEMPLLAIECQKITEAKNKKIVPILGGKESNAYNNKSLRGKVYRDLELQLRREFGVTSYKAIRRNQADKAVGIIESYELPLCLKEEIEDENAQIKL